jgi:hypothetical protein
MRTLVFPQVNAIFSPNIRSIGHAVGTFWAQLQIPNAPNPLAGPGAFCRGVRRSSDLCRDHPPAAREDPVDPLVTLAGADDPPVVTAAVVGTNPVMKDSDGTLFCRRDFVLALCNKEGGLTLVESAAPGGSCWLALPGNAQGTGEVGCGLGVVCWRWQQHLPWRLAGRIRQTAKRSL